MEGRRQGEERIDFLGAGVFRCGERILSCKGRQADGQKEGRKVKACNCLDDVSRFSKSMWDFAGSEAACLWRWAVLVYGIRVGIHHQFLKARSLPGCFPTSPSSPSSAALAQLCLREKASRRTLVSHVFCTVVFTHVGSWEKRQMNTPTDNL